MEAEDIREPDMAEDMAEAVAVVPAPVHVRAPALVPVAAEQAAARRIHTKTKRQKIRWRIKG